MTARAALIEIFDSIQGEGRFVGSPMAFVRVATCPIRCRYCDTPNSYQASGTFPVGDGVVEPNPVTAERAVELVAAARAGRDLIVSLTGGEPLAMPAFASEFGACVRNRNDRGVRGRAHLETAALDPDALREVVAHFDHISADFKLPGTLHDDRDPRDAHKACFDVAVAAGLSLDIKLVLTRSGAADAGLRAMTATDLEPWRERAVIILQPVTPFGDVQEPADAEGVSAWAREFDTRGFDVRVIPQTHKFLGVE